MRYGNDDQAGNAEVEAARKRSQRWIQLALKPKQKLIRHYMREMSKRGRVNLVGGPLFRPTAEEGTE